MYTHTHIYMRVCFSFLILLPHDLQANIAVCRADDSGATALSAVAASKNLYGTQCIGLFGKIRSWKSVSDVALHCG